MMDDKLNQPGAEYVLGAASLDQARMTYAFVRAALEPTGEYRFIDSTTRLGITHKASNTKLRVISSNAKSAFGLVNVPMAVIDESGALEIVGWQMMADALFTAQGKVGSVLKLVLIGTLSTMATGPGHWWYVFSPPLTRHHQERLAGREIDGLSRMPQVSLRHRQGSVENPGRHHLPYRG